VIGIAESAELTTSRDARIALGAEQKAHLKKSAWWDEVMTDIGRISQASSRKVIGIAMSVELTTSQDAQIVSSAARKAHLKKSAWWDEVMSGIGRRSQASLREAIGFAMSAELTTSQGARIASSAARKAHLKKSARQVEMMSDSGRRSQASLKEVIGSVMSAELTTSQDARTALSAVHKAHLKKSGWWDEVMSGIGRRSQAGSKMVIGIAKSVELTTSQDAQIALGAAHKALLNQSG